MDLDEGSSTSFANFAETRGDAAKPQFHWRRGQRTSGGRREGNQLCSLHRAQPRTPPGPGVLGSLLGSELQAALWAVQASGESRQESSWHCLLSRPPPGSSTPRAQARGQTWVSGWRAGLSLGAGGVARLGLRGSLGQGHSLPQRVRGHGHRGPG